MSYTQVSAGRYHTALLRNDGHVVACGDNYFGQRDIPALDEGMAYIQVSSGGCHTVFLRSDGMCVCVACGCNQFDQCNIPSPKTWGDWVGFTTASRRYMCNANLMPVCMNHVLQLSFAFQDDAIILIFSSLSGNEVLRLKAYRFDLVHEICQRIARELNVELLSLRVVLPNGHLAASACSTNPRATIASLSEDGGK